jgi:hypothetical protein
MDFPRFDGSNPHEWLHTMEKYFAMVYVPEDAKFDYAQMYITAELILGYATPEFLMRS